MSEWETILIQELNDIDRNDPEGAHALADDVLLRSVPPEIQAAYLQVVEECGWWATS